MGYKSREMEMEGRERFVYSEGSTTLISSSFALLIRKQIFWIKMNIQ
jgi:hypothetical protein